MKKTGRTLLAALLTLALISCGEEENAGSSNVTYTDDNTEITSPTKWKTGSTITVDCTLDIKSTLTIEPGCIIKFTENGYLKVGETENGAIVANGTTEKPILFTVPDYLTNLANNIRTLAGSWHGLYLGQRNQINTTSLRHCIFEGAGKQNTPCIELYKTSLSMESCIIRDCASTGIKAGILSEFETFSENLLIRCDGFLLSGIPESIVDLDTTNTFSTTIRKGIAIQEGTIDFNATLTKQSVPYTVQGALNVKNADLTIEQGTTILFDAETSLNIGYEGYGALIAVGTQAEPILFTSSATTPAAGDWEGLVFYEGTSSSGTILKHVTIDYAGKPMGAFEGAIHTYKPIKVEDCLIKNSKTYGVWCNQGVGFTGFSGNTIQYCQTFPLCIDVAYAHTIGQNNTLSENEDNGILLTEELITGDVRWLNHNVPYILAEGLIIRNLTAVAKLTLNPGCVLKLAQGRGISVDVNASLVANGSVSAPITFTSLANSPANGDWSGICFEEGSDAGNLLNYCTVEYAGGYTDFNVGIRSSNATVSNSTIRHSSMHGIYVYVNEPAYNPTLQNNTFSNNQGQDVYYEQ